MFKNKMMFVLTLTILVGCNAPSKDQLKKTLVDNPDILIDVIKAHPSDFIDALNDAVRVAQKDQAKKREDEEKKQLEEAFEKPLKPVLRNDELYRGTKGAPITIVEYSDFECPFCRRGYNTVMALLKKYEGKVQFVYKHLPLSFHPQAMISSQYYEAIRLQSEDKAVKFHDEVYENQSKLRQGEKFLKAAAKKLGVDMKKLAKDVNSSSVKKRIDEDMKEAAKFGFQGTPGFLVNGVPVKGAFPEDHFVKIIDELKKRGKVNL